MTELATAEMAAADPRLYAEWSDWLAPSSAQPLAALRDLHYTYDGQSALFQAFAALRPHFGGRVLIPAYHCPTVVEPILRAGFEIEFYDVDTDLRRPVVPFSAQLDVRHDVLVVINYFGFEFDLTTLPAPDRRPLVVEDCCHSFLRGSSDALTGGRGDIAVYSFKKLLPCITGGALRYNRANLPRPPPPQAVTAGREVAYARRLLSDTWARNARRHRQPEVMQGPVVQPPLEVAYPWPPQDGMATIPSLAKRIVFGSDLAECARRRRANYARVAGHLVELSAVACPLPALDAATCPWGFPILLAERAATDFRLKNLGVPFNSFGEQLHPALLAQAAAYPRAVELSHRLLFLAVHQQLSPAQVDRYCAAMETFFAGDRLQ